jgi:hypothetical protein
MVDRTWMLLLLLLLLLVREKGVRLGHAIRPPKGWHVCLYESDAASLTGGQAGKTLVVWL